MGTAHRYHQLPELIGNELNPVVAGFFEHTRFPLELLNAKTNWCAAYACSVLEQHGIRSPRSARARDFLRWGVELKSPIYGALLVFERGSGAPDDPRGHVGFCEERVHIATNSHVLTWGGNQGNTVRSWPQHKAKLLGVRWPSAMPLPPEAILI